MVRIIVLFLIASFGLALCNISTVQLLVLVPWPSDRDGAGWDAGLDLLAGGRVAANEINNVTDLLKDYHIELLVPEYGHEACALVETSQGLINFVQNSINASGQVLAVLGLYCSASAKEISSLAGLKSVQLIHLSAANSPIFDPEISKKIGYAGATLQQDYPHLWRFLTSASVYTDMMIELMTIFSWKNIVVIHHTDNAYFYSGIAHILIKKISDRILFDIDFSALYLNGSLDRIYNEGGRIIFVAATSLDAARLLCGAAERGMLYPDYIWIIVTDHSLSYLENTNQCHASMLHRALHGSILPIFSLEPQDKTMKLVNGDAYSTYESRFYEELDMVAEEYNQTLSGDHQSAGLLYDQVWAFALALNSSIPELNKHNLSVTDIGSLGYSKAKNILEDKLSQLNFKGASGHIRFSNKREVPSTSINIYQVINGQQKLVGNCTVDNSSLVYCNVTLIEMPPSSELHVVTQILELPTAVIVAMHVTTALTVVLITIVMVLFLYNREMAVIKATSWKLSILQFLSCYALCISMILVTLQVQYSCMIYCFIQLFLQVIAINLIVVVSFVRVYRVHQIFHNKTLRALDWQYSDRFLTFLAVMFSLIPVMILVPWYSISGTKGLIFSSAHKIEFNGISRHYSVVQQYCTIGTIQPSVIFPLLIIMYLHLFMTANIVFALRTRKSYTNFKDTKKLILLVLTMWVLHIIFSVILFIFVQQLLDADWNSFSHYIYSLSNVFACIFIFYIPKLWWLCCK